MRCSLLVLSSYLDGELDAHKCGELEAHLVGCERCRSGLGYLGEEVERISALAVVHVPDHSVHALFEQLGMLGTADPLPYRLSPAALGPPPEAPPWLTAGAAGQALPWDARIRDAHRSEIPELHDVRLPGRAQFNHAGVPVADPIAAQASARAVNSPPTDGGAADVPPGSSPVAGVQIRDDPPPAAAAADPHSMTQQSARAKGITSAPATPRDLAPVGDDVANTVPGAEPPVGGSPLVPPISTETTPGRRTPTDGFDEGQLDDDEQYLSGGPQRAARPTVLERIRDRIGVYRAIARGPRDDLGYDDSVQIVSGVGAPLRPVRGGTMYSHASQTAPPPPPDYPGVSLPAAAPPSGTAAVPPGTGGGGVEMHSLRAEDEFVFDAVPNTPSAYSPAPTSPPAMPEPAAGGLRNDRASAPAPDAAASAVPAPPRPVVPGPGLESQADPTTIRAFSGSLGPAGADRTGSAPPLHGEVVTPAAAAAAAAAQTRPGPVDMPVMPGDEDDFLDSPSPSPRPLRPTGPTRAAATRGSWAGPLATGVNRFRASGGERRPLAMFGGAVALLMIAGLVTGRSSTPATGGGREVATVLRPALAEPPAAKPASVPSATPQPAGLTGEQDLGGGGSGYQVKAIRYGVHPGDFRVVFDLSDAGGATGTPKAVIGWTGAATFQVRLSGVIAAGSTGQLPTTNPVSSVTLIQPPPVAGTTAYQFTVAHAVTLTSVYTSGPLRLIIDLH